MTSINNEGSYYNKGSVKKQAEKLKSREMKEVWRKYEGSMNEEWWKMKDEWRMMKDKGWWFQAF